MTCDEGEPHTGGTGGAEAPEGTRALLVTSGSILAVQAANLSFLLDVAMLTLGRNYLLVIQDSALQGLPRWWIPGASLLEHNRISSPAIPEATCQSLWELQVLTLESIQGTWFRNTKALWWLLLDGHQLQTLMDGTCCRVDHSLDFSNHLIGSLGEGALGVLPGLWGVDLVHVPSVFDPPTGIFCQGLGKDEWHCPRALQPLAPRLRSSTANSSVLRGSRGQAPKFQGPTVVAAAAVVAAYAMLPQAEADCEYKAPNLTLVFKDKESSPSGREVAQVTILCLAGAVGLTCLILAILNWRLHRGKGKPPSDNLCCRTLRGSPCAHEPRNDFMPHCTCCVSQENETKIMSMVGSRKEVPARLERISESMDLKASFRNLPQGKGCGPDNGSFLCFNCRLQQPGLPENSRNTVVIHEASPMTSHFQRRGGKLRHSEPAEIQKQPFKWSSRRTMDISSGILNGRGSMPTSALARENFETHLTNELWQPPMEAGDDVFQPHQQRHFITSSSTNAPRSKHARGHRQVRSQGSHCPGPHRWLGQSRLKELPPDKSLICKYIPYDQLQDSPNERKLNYRTHLKSQRDQTQANSASKEFLSSGDNTGLSSLVQKARVRKRVSFHLPNLEEENGLALLLPDSREAGPLWTQQQSPQDHIASHQSEKLNKMQEKTKGANCSSDVQIPENEWTKASYPKRKVKGQNLNIKLNLHPFRKLRIHPEKQPDREKGPPKFSKRGKKIAQQKLSKVTVEETVQKERPRSPGGVGGSLEQMAWTPTAPTTWASGRSQWTPNVSRVMPGDSERPREQTHHIPDEVPVQDHSGIPTGCPPQSSPKESMENMLFLPSLGLITSGTRQESAKDHFKPQHFQLGEDQVTPETTEAGESQVSQTVLEQTKTHLVHGVQSDTNQKAGRLEGILPSQLQHSCPPQLGAEEGTRKSRSKTASQRAQCCISKGGLRSPHKTVSRVEACDSSLLPQTQSNSDITFVETNFIPHQNRLEFSNDINTPLLGTQTNWHPTSRSKKGTDSANGLPRDDGDEVPRDKIGVEENKKASHRSKVSCGTVIKAKDMVLPGAAEETQPSQKNGKSESQTFLGSNLVRQNHVSSNRSPEIQPGLLPSEAGPQIYNHAMKKDAQEVQDIGPDEGDNEQGEDTMPPEKQEDAFVLPEVKDSHFEAENEVPLISSRVNEAENCVAHPPPLPPSAEYANPSPLAVEQSEPNNSNNNGFLL
ncbi:leucine-rich repeat-containing protein 53 [Macrotis lagotis]|uniref:leucine-rich repeat-containing protein 53 n=1 Tax=Macrotis lagotis TaxID=92651 RepID=UPI003D6844C2